MRLAEWLETALRGSDRQLLEAAKELGLEEKELNVNEARQRAAQSFLDAADFAKAPKEQAHHGPS